MSDENFDSSYYEKLACQQIAELTEDLHTIGFALAYQIRATEEAKQNYLRYHESMVGLQKSYEKVDRLLAQLDGRHKQCETSSDVEKKKRKEKKLQSPAQFLAKLSKEQKEELVKQLMEE